MSRQTKSNRPRTLLQSLIVLAVVVALLAGQRLGLLSPGGQDAASPIIDPQQIVNYLDAHGKLPDNFITKAEAEALGWDSRQNYVSDVAPGKSIGGDRFGNYEGLLPRDDYREADCWYESGPRNACRLVFSDDAYYYTEDHYETFQELTPGK